MRRLYFEEPLIVTAKPFPELNALHERHHALTKPMCEVLAEAAWVCMSRHHESPKDLIVATSSENVFSMSWTRPDQRQEAAHANMNVATDMGACSVSIAGVECALGLYAISRCENRTGADYWLDLDKERKDLETGIRLEVSGVDHGGKAPIGARVREKIRQTQRGVPRTIAYAAVVGFLNARLVIVEAPQAPDG